MKDKKRSEKRIRHANMLRAQAYPCPLGLAGGRGSRT